MTPTVTSGFSVKRAARVRPAVPDIQRLAIAEAAVAMARTSTTDQVVEFSLGEFFDGANGRSRLFTGAIGMAISRSHDEIYVVGGRKD